MKCLRVCGEFIKFFLLIACLIGTGTNRTALAQEARPPLSQDELLDLITSKTPSKVIISIIKASGIAFQPTPQILELFRKSGADREVLAALRGAWHGVIPKPLGDNELLVMVAGGTPGATVMRSVQERGIDFQPSQDYLEELKSDGGSEALIELLRRTSPRPLTKEEVLQQLRMDADQQRLAQKIHERGIDFDAVAQNLQALRTAGAGAPLLDTIRAAHRARAFVAPPPVALPPPPDSRAVAPHSPVPLVCEPSDHDVPVFATSADLGKVVARLKCGEKVTFVERVAVPPGFDKIEFGDGQQGLVSNSYLEPAVATPGGAVTAPAIISQPNAPYTPQARHDRREGAVKLTIVIDAQGNVTDVQESSPSLGDGLDESAIATVKKWKFSPATRDGSPVPVRVQVEITFHLGPNAH